MRTLLICHGDAELTRDGLARWLASFSELAGLVVLDEPSSLRWRRLHRELRRVGAWRLLDVLAFRLYYRLALSRRDAAWQRAALAELRQRFAPLDAALPILRASSPNTPEVERFLTELAPDLVLARCKMLIRERIFSIPRCGIYVLHPGICPEYRNSHGCFWALARDDLEKVGLTLLRIDRGVDSGPVYGYYTYPYDELAESHVVIQQRMVLENLDRIRDRLLEIAAGVATPLDTAGRESALWGQPWLTRHLAWRRRARRRAAGRSA